ncbi:MAG: cyclase family protein [Clostridia bacterium]|nr:cyclase family protein [Clostridia bacterium]
MLLDITMRITPELRRSAPEKEDRTLVGHLGTHFDVMDKEFPLEYIRREGIAFDVSGIRQRDIDTSDIDLGRVKKGQFVAFYTGFVHEEPYGTKRYFAEHPQLSDRLIDALLEREISIIGIDCSGVRRGKEHFTADQRCADRRVFVVENLCDLKALVKAESFWVNTYPVRYSGMTGLPCRVIAELR